nr:ATP-binding protein [Endobacter medicaginis]
MVHGSVVRFEQVLVNLLGNAIEALDGAGRIEIEIAADASAVRLSVSDDGPGIAPELAAQLFLPFATSRPSGLGLGLVIAQDIMAECGGTLRQLDRARGACFEMTMRRVAA